MENGDPVQFLKTTVFAGTTDKLEIAKLLVSALMPIAVAWLGYVINRTSNRRAHVTERRIKVFDQVAQDLNDLYCYFSYVGHWKGLTPPEVLSKKRKLDRIIHINRFLFTRRFYKRYKKFIDLCSQAYSAPGEDAKLRTITRDSEQKEVWNEEWNKMFTDRTLSSSPRTIERAYSSLMHQFSMELGIGL